jgi:hypothetical protein
MQRVTKFLMMQFILLASLGAAQTASGACISLPLKSEQPSVISCETTESISIQVLDESHVYNKRDYFAGLTRLIRQSLEHVGIAPSTVIQGTLRFWLSVPEINPAAVQGRAAITIDNRELVINLPVFMENWNDSTVGFVAINEGQSYPKSFGHAIGKIIIATAAELAESDLDAKLQNISPLLSVSHKISNNRYSIYIPALNEQSWAEDLTNCIRISECGWLTSAEVNQVMEWIAHRGMVFSFVIEDEMVNR